MPLVHFPARTAIDAWSSWEALKSAEDRGVTRPRGPFGRLRWGHVFAYGGPCCFGHPEAIGDAAMYFAPASEQDAVGSASPFDSGALEPPDARLRPFATEPVGARWRLLESHSVSLATWREAFREWLVACYSDPERYLETRGDRYADGLPDRTRPEEIRTHNGRLGQERYGELVEVADRRAWTWEVRFAGHLPIAHVAALQVPLRSRETAVRLRERLRWTGAAVPAIRTLPRGMVASPQALYEDSGPLLQELTR